MKSWLGVIGRACLEFAIILVLFSFAAGAASSVAAPVGGLRIFNIFAARAAFDLIPLAVVVTLFLAFFSFELRVKSRVAGWLGLVFLGSLLLSFGIGLRRVPPIHDALLAEPASRTEATRFVSPGIVVQKGRLALWLGSYEGDEAIDAVAVDFGSDYPRLAYAARSPLDRGAGTVDVQGRSYSAFLPAPRPFDLIPEAKVFAGEWIWDRLAAMDGEPLLVVFATAGGFLLLLVGCRFLCRLTGWPLANALLATVGLAGLVALDAALSNPVLLMGLTSLAKRGGLALSEPLALAVLEAFVGLAFAGIDLARSPAGRRGLDE
jgi:hypothetical protein